MWTTENFPFEMNDLDPKIREKAIQIANELRESQEVSELNIVKEAIRRAQQWFISLEG